MKITCLCIGILFLGIGFLFANGKLWTYMDMKYAITKEEKAFIQVEKLYQNIGFMIASSGVIFVLNGVWDAFSKQGFTIAMVIWLLLATLDLLYIEKRKQSQIKQTVD